MNTETPKVILSVNFGLFGENIVTSFIKAELKRRIMEELYEVGPKKQRKFEMFPVISR